MDIEQMELNSMTLEEQDLFGDEEKDLQLVEINTDGSTYPGNPGAGGIGVIFRVKRDDVTHIKTISRAIPEWVELKGSQLKLAMRAKKNKPVSRNGKYYMQTTNNRAEILAVIESLMRVKSPEKCHVVVNCDSQWAINMSNGTWNAKENLELVARAQEMVKKFPSIEFKWVRGHAGDRFNEWCDELAYYAAKEQPKHPVIEVTKE